MSQVQIKKMRIKHDAILEWLIANPEASMGECAQYFGVSRSWLSIIVNSDAFQRKYQRLMKEYHDLRIVPLRDKMNGIASRALDKVADHVEKSEDPKFQLDVANDMVKALGYGAKAPAGVQVNQYNSYQQQTLYSVDRETLNKARAAFREHSRGPVLEHQPEAAQAGGAPEEGETVLAEPGPAPALQVEPVSGSGTDGASWIDGLWEGVGGG